MKPILLLLAFFPITTHAQISTKQEKVSIQIKYDRFRDETTVRAPLVVPSRNRLSLEILVSAVHPGREPASPKSVAFLVYSRGSFAYLSETQMILLIDGERVTLEGSSRLSSNVAFIPANLYLLKSIAEAKSVEGQISSVEFKVKPEQQRAIGRIAAYFSDAGFR
jgi:hypothetical protein